MNEKIVQFPGPRSKDSAPSKIPYPGYTRVPDYELSPKEMDGMSLLEIIRYRSVYALRALQKGEIELDYAEQYISKLLNNAVR